MLPGRSLSLVDALVKSSRVPLYMKSALRKNDRKIIGIRNASVVIVYEHNAWTVFSGELMPHPNTRNNRLNNYVRRSRLYFDVKRVQTEREGEEYRYISPLPESGKKVANNTFIGQIVGKTRNFFARKYILFPAKVSLIPSLANFLFTLLGLLDLNSQQLTRSCEWENGAKTWYTY